MNASKILSEKEVFTSKYFRVKQVVVEINGKQFTKDIIDRNNSVFIIPIADDGAIYFERQYRDALQSFTLELVAGTMESNESDPLEVAKRELKEETGFTATEWKQLPTINSSANLRHKYFTFIAKKLAAGKSALEDDEVIELTKLTLDEALQKIEDGEINIASNITAILMYEKLLKEGKV